MLALAKRFSAEGLERFPVDATLIDWQDYLCRIHMAGLNRWSAFTLTGPGETEVICLWNKARRRDIANHGKQAQRGAADKASSIDGTVRVTALYALRRRQAMDAEPVSEMAAAAELAG